MDLQFLKKRLLENLIIFLYFWNKNLKLKFVNYFLKIQSEVHNNTYRRICLTISFNTYINF